MVQPSFPPFHHIDILPSTAHANPRFCAISIASCSNYVVGLPWSRDIAKSQILRAGVLSGSSISPRSTPGSGSLALFGWMIVVKPACLASAIPSNQSPAVPDRDPHARGPHQYRQRHGISRADNRGQLRVRIQYLAGSARAFAASLMWRVITGICAGSARRADTHQHTGNAPALDCISAPGRSTAATAPSTR